VLVRQHDDRVADFELGVADLAARRTKAQPLAGAERLFIEFNGANAVGDDQVRGSGSGSRRGSV
jgi:hypothetical protein